MATSSRIAKTKDAPHKAIDARMGPGRALNQGLIVDMDQVVKRFRNDEFYTCELRTAGALMHAAQSRPLRLAGRPHGRRHDSRCTNTSRA